ncbi:META domain-containing protein [Streptomyces sp. NPDC002573]|uniref:META domain-containing protein n=1 Tax=Streptomyces sp. NPDC002573 TaxID=3364651 RepID=UPI0036C9EA85
MDKHRLALTVLTLLPLVVACGTGAASDGSSGSASAGTGSASAGTGSVVRRTDPSSVTGVHWRVDSLSSGGTTRKAPDGAYLRIDDHGRAHGNYGCNSFGAAAAFRDGRIDFGPAEATDMACAKEPMAFESAFSRALAGRSLAAAVDHGRLTLTTENGDRVRLTREGDASLHGTRWRITALVDKDVASSLPAAAAGKAWFTLDRKAGTASGSLGCNRFTARATVRDRHLTLSSPRTTRKMCDGSLMSVERNLTERLARPLSYRLTHRGITLTSENGKGVQAAAER